MSLASLQLTEEDWPTSPDLPDLPDNAEIKRTREVYAANLTDGQSTPTATDRLLERYSNWHRLKRATAILLHLKSLLRKETDAKLQHIITVDELRDAEVAILRHVQKESFGSVEVDGKDERYC